VLLQCVVHFRETATNSLQTIYMSS